MAARSTRQKIRDQAAKMIKSCEDIAFHMKNLSDLADRRSKVINNYIPMLITLQDEFLKALMLFSAEL